jgi:hypothetical protein
MASCRDIHHVLCFTASAPLAMTRSDLGGMQFKPGHGCYDPLRALNATEPYAFDYKHRCEPYTVALKEAMPQFDQRWRGRNLDKVSYLTHMAAWGTKFTVAPDLFMIHLPHNKARALVEPGDGLAGPRVMNDFQALPAVLARVHLSDIRRQPQFQREVPLIIASVNPAQLKAAMDADRAEAARARSSAGRAADEAGSGGGGGGSRPASQASLAATPTDLIERRVRSAATKQAVARVSSGRTGQRRAESSTAMQVSLESAPVRWSQDGAGLATSSLQSPCGNFVSCWTGAKSVQTKLGGLPLFLGAALCVVPAWLWWKYAILRASRAVSKNNALVRVR